MILKIVLPKRKEKENTRKAVQTVISLKTLKIINLKVREKEVIKIIKRVWTAMILETMITIMISPEKNKENTIKQINNMIIMIVEMMMMIGIIMK